MEMLHLGIGLGIGGLDHIGRIGFAATGAGVGGGALNRNAFYTGLDDGLAIDITPMGDMLRIGFGLARPAGPSFSESATVTADAAAALNRQFPNNRASAVFGGIHARVRFDLDGIGHFGLAYQGGGYDMLSGDNIVFGTGADALWLSDAGIDDVPAWDLGSLFAMARITAVENLEFDLGIRFNLGHSIMENLLYTTPPAGTPARSVQDPDTGSLQIGLGANYNINQDFEVRLRASAGFRFADYSPTEIAFDIWPHFRVNETLSVFLLAGLRLTLWDHPGDSPENRALRRWLPASTPATTPPDGSEAGFADNGVEWNIHPYVRVSAGGPAFWAGIRIWGTNLNGDGWNATNNIGRGGLHNNVRPGANESLVNWAVPLGLTFAF
jgi:hypothetical protein